MELSFPSKTHGAAGGRGKERAEGSCLPSLPHPANVGRCLREGLLLPAFKVQGTLRGLPWLFTKNSREECDQSCCINKNEHSMNLLNVLCPSLSMGPKISSLSFRILPKKLKSHLRVQAIATSECWEVNRTIHAFQRTKKMLNKCSFPLPLI